MTRRSWFSQLFGKSGGDVYFLGLQLVIKAFGEDTLRARIANVINDPNADTQNTAAKRQYLKRIVALLEEQEPYWHEVFWDYKAGREEAEAEFEAWASELQANSATEGEEMEGAVDGMYRLSSNKDYVAVTLIFNLSVPFPPAEIDDEAYYWTRNTIRQLVNGLLFINPETIMADGVFVVPGSSQDGLSEEDLLTGGWQYLHLIT